MDKLNFYHQKRSDGGLRTGIDFNDERVLERFEPGDAPSDSALLWFVDVRCSGENLPSEPDAIRCWFFDRSEIICAALREMAQNLLAGIDPGWPMRHPIIDDGVRMAIYCSATRRLTGREISEILSDLAKTWPDVIRSLASYAHSVSSDG
jgi:hypothetical protein